MSLGLGLAFKQGTSNPVRVFASREYGIEATIPDGWLVDEGGAYVLRVRDPKARPYKTQFRIQVLPISGSSSVQFALDSLTLQRAASLAAYRVLDVDFQSQPGDVYAETSFAFVDADPNPFIQRLPVVVLGRDLVILDDERAIILTIMADTDSFDDNWPLFSRMAASLRY